MNENKYDNKEPYEPITEDIADNDLLEEYEAQLAEQKQAQNGAQPVNDAQPVMPPRPMPPAEPDGDKPPIYKQWWFWLIIVLVVVAIIVGLVVALSKGDKKTDTSTSSSVSTSAQSTAGSSTTGQSDTKQSTTASTKASTTKKSSSVEDEEDKQARYNLALEKAKALNNLMHLSRQGIYNELTSSQGEGLKEDAVNYALDHLNADYRANAMATAQQYVAQGISEEDIYNKLVNEDLFTDDEAQYAVDHL